MEVAIAGGGIGGLALALNLHRRGISCHVYETAPEIRELGVGITLLPHAMRELTTLGVQDAIKAVGIENVEEQLAIRIEGRVRYDQIHVEVEITVIQQTAAGKSQVDSVIEFFVASIGAAVHVDHAAIALVDILRSKEEPVVMGP